MRALVLLGLSLAVAGCVVPGSVSPASLAPGAPVEHDALGGLPSPYLLDHRHDDPTLHQVAARVARLQHVGPSWGGVSFILGEMDLLGADHLLVASFVPGGFLVFDVTDRAAPKLVSWTPVPGMGSDVKATPEGDLAFVATDFVGVMGIRAFKMDVRERPLEVGFLPLQGGCHMLTIHAGHVYCSGDASVRIFRIDRLPGGLVQLVGVGRYAPLGTAPTMFHEIDRGFDLAVHDMTVTDDPVTGRAVMLASFWDHGVRVVDVEDPAAPVELGFWQGEGADDTYQGNVHSAALAMVDGRRVIVTTPEWPEYPTLTFLDATDYADLKAVGVFAPARDVGDAKRAFSSHNLQVVGGRVYTAGYHAGVVVIDASSWDALVAPTMLGFALPAERLVVNPQFREFSITSPSIWDVVVKEGHLYATDMGSGLHVLHFEGDERGDVTRTSTT